MIIYRNIVLFYILLFVSSIKLYSQRDRVQNLPEFDERFLHFGFSLGLNQGDFFLRHNNLLVDSLQGIEVKRQPGFNINMISELHFLRYCGLRFNPGLCLTSRVLEYRFLDKSGKTELYGQPIEATYLEFPLFVKYRSERLNNFAVYMLAGGQYNLDLSSQEKTDNNQNTGADIVIKTKRDNYGYTLGGGMDFFMEFYKFSLELKYHVGVNNVIVPDNTIYSIPIEILKPRMFTVSISFEG